MTRREKAERDAITRLRAALLDLMTAQRFTEANDVAAIIERIEPPTQTGFPAVVGEAASAARADGSAAGSGSASLSPVTSTPATYSTTYPSGYMPCQNCDKTLAAHCTTHLLPCCPGSLMHGQDEGTWTPAP